VSDTKADKPAPPTAESMGLPPMPRRAQALREMFAAHALQGVLASDVGGSLTPDAAARQAVEHADALIRRLAAPGVPEQPKPE
jgi:hypothetical protein